MDQQAETTFARFARWVGLAGGVLGLFGAVLSVVNFYTLPDEQRIAVALDVSRSYLREVKLETIDLLVQAQTGMELTPT